MNILTIGNGFDLAHELPTTYVDFLKFIEIFKDYPHNSAAYRKRMPGSIENYVVNLYESKEDKDKNLKKELQGLGVRTKSWTPSI